MCGGGGGSHQVVVGEPGDLLLHAVLHLGLGGQRHGVVQGLRLLLQVGPQHLDLGVQRLQLVLMLPGQALHLGLQHPERGTDGWMNGLDMERADVEGWMDNRTDGVIGWMNGR